jgi:hypothetical protein
MGERIARRRVAFAQLQQPALTNENVVEPGARHFGDIERGAGFEIGAGVLGRARGTMEQREVHAVTVDVRAVEE